MEAEDPEVRRTDTPLPDAQTRGRPARKRAFARRPWQRAHEATRDPAPKLKGTETAPTRILRQHAREGP